MPDQRPADEPTPAPTIAARISNANRESPDAGAIQPRNEKSVLGGPAFPPPEPVVRVSIGRVELRAGAPPPPPAPVATRRLAALSLEAYLAQRGGEGR